MKTAILNTREISDKKTLHAALAAQLDFPDWYGGNLDALYDLLSASSQPCAVVIRDAPALETALGEYARRLLRVLTDVCFANPAVSLRIEGKGETAPGLHFSRTSVPPIKNSASAPGPTWEPVTGS